MKSISYQSLGSVVQNLSVNHISSLGQVAGKAMWFFLPQRRNMTIEAINYHLELEKEKARQIAYSNFKHMGRAFFELFLNRKIDHRFVESHISIKNPENLFQVVSEKRPIVSITAHLGAWELLAGILSLYFRDRPAQIITQRIKNPSLNQLVLHFRKHSGVDILYNKQSSRKIFRCLKNIGISAFLADHNCGRRKAIFLPFFKKYAAVNMGPAFLATHSQALLWPVFLLRDNKQYIFYPQKPLDTLALTGSNEEKVAKAAYFYTKTIENMVKEYPDQWFWMHKRWKTQPKSEKELQYISVAKDFNS